MAKKHKSKKHKYKVDSSPQSIIDDVHRGLEMRRRRLLSTPSTPSTSTLDQDRQHHQDHQHHQHHHHGR